MGEHWTLLLLFVGCALVAGSHLPLRRYHFISAAMPWAEAQRFCRLHYSDLATFESEEDLLQLPPALGSSWAWIGLRDDPGTWKGVMGGEPNSWRWSAPGGASPGGFQNWAAAEPDFADRFETCVMMSPGGEWQDKNCNTRTGFLCSTEGESFVFVSSPLSWAEAKAHCRLHHSDLAVIQSSSQNSIANGTRASGAEAWIGLHRRPWAWSDHSLSSFRNWRTNSPNWPGIQHCATLHRDDGWDDDYCSYQYPVICQTDLRMQALMRVTVKTSADLTALLNNDQCLQKAEEALKSHGNTDVRVAWTTQPIKQTTEKKPEPKCDKEQQGK